MNLPQSYLASYLAWTQLQELYGNDLTHKQSSPFSERSGFQLVYLVLKLRSLTSRVRQAQS